MSTTISNMPALASGRNIIKTHEHAFIPTITAKKITSEPASSIWCRNTVSTARSANLSQILCVKCGVSNETRSKRLCMSRTYSNLHGMAVFLPE
jgi:hypothetical protein